MSKECLKSELDLFMIPPTQTSIESNSYIEIRPLTALTDSSPVEFHITGCNEDYLDLNNTYLYTKVKITRANGANLTAVDNVGFINYPGNTIFSQLDVTLGDRLISNSGNNYPYRCMIECLTNYSAETLNTQFGNGLFHMDTAGHMNVTATDGENVGLTKRAAYTNNGQSVELIALVHADIFF